MENGPFQSRAGKHWVRPVYLVPAVLLAALILAGILEGNQPVYAGENLWTWGGISGSVETILSNPVDPGTVYAVADNRYLFKIVDGGELWQKMPDLPHAGIALHLRLAPNDGRVLYLWGYDGGAFLYRSKDGGGSWQGLSMAGELAVSPADWKEVYLAQAGGFYKSIDGGDNWVEVSRFPAACTQPSYLAIAPSAPHIMMSVFNPPSLMDFYLCKTMDGGNTWSPLSISSPGIHSVVFDPKNSDTIYLASIGGGWKSTDGGISWRPLSNGLNNPAQFVIDPDNTQVIHAADLNITGGVFESLDGGETWTKIDWGIQGLSVRTIAIGGREPLEIYAGVVYSGLWEITRTTLQDYSLTINDGDMFTNQTAVTLTLTAPPGTAQMIISNDGGFGGAEWEAYTGTKPWTVIPYENYVIPRTVYAKFLTNGQVSGLYLDDIILDQTVPTGTLEITTPLTAYLPGLLPVHPEHTPTDPAMVYLPLIGFEYRPGLRAVVLELSASDDVSGVDGFKVSNEAEFTGAQWQPYTRRIDWWVSDRGTTTVYVKYRDRAGNESQVITASTTAP